MAYTLPLDIINRTLQRVGDTRITAYPTTPGTSKAPFEAVFAYDKMRLVELQKNLWRFSTRRAILRAIGIDTVLWTPPTWASPQTASAGSVYAYTPLTGPYVGAAIYWQTFTAETSSTVTPDTDPNFEKFTGVLAVDLYNTGIDGNTTNTYESGELVLVPAAYASGTTYSINQVVSSGTSWYVSLTSSNTGNAVTDTTNWALWTSRGRSDGSYGVTSGNSPVPLTYPGSYSIYLSLYNNNADNPASATGTWLSVGGSVVPLQMVWPMGAGPLHDLNTRNVFYLPNGFLKRAPTDPKAGQTPYLGAASGASPEDWVLEGRYLVSGDARPLMMRFVADLVSVPSMDPMFCEGLSARIAVEIGEMILADPQKRNLAMGEYQKAISDARQTNAIEIGPISQVENRYVTVRT